MGSSSILEAQPADGVAHLFTVDVEEYFQVQALEPYVNRSSWDTLPSRVAPGTERLLELLAAARATGTFFVLGWVAHKYPDLVRKIADAGHEIASHGWSHSRVTSLSPDQFRAEVRDSKQILEDIAGLPVRGFRAPSFSIVPRCAWALDVLIEEGYEYDSSLFPIRRPGYGHPDALTVPFLARRRAGDLLELPPATIDTFRMRIPAGGGGYLRQFPLAVSRYAYRIASDRRVPATLYVHPWELDPEQPRVDAPLLTRIRHYRGIDKTASRLASLLSEFSFTSIGRWIDTIGPVGRTGLPVRTIA